jgi:hypothetical protein
MHQNLGGTPGALVGTVSATANIGFLFQGRTSPTQTGTFLSVLDEFDFTSTFNGHTFTGRLASQSPTNPGPPSTGSTTITPITADGPFIISGFFDIFAERRSVCTRTDALCGYPSARAIVPFAAHNRRRRVIGSSPI